MENEKISQTRRNLMIGGGIAATSTLFAGSLLSPLACAQATSISTTTPIAEAVSNALNGKKTEHILVPYGQGNSVVTIKALAEMAASGFQNMHGTIELFFKNTPILAMSQIIESLLLKVAGTLVGGIAGSIFSGAISGLFGYFFSLFTTNKPSIQDEIQRITGEMIDKNNYNILASSMDGINSVYKDFNTTLSYILEKKTRDNSLTLLIAKYGDVISTVKARMNDFINLSNGIGFLFYLQAATIGIIAHTQILKNRETLNLDDKFFNLSLMLLRDNAAEWMKNAQKIIIEKFKETGSRANAVVKYYRDVYTGGYAMLLSAYRVSFAFNFAADLDVRNTVELYSDVPTDIANGPFNTLATRINKDIHVRSSLLSLIDMVGHKDNVLAIRQEYFDGKGQIKSAYIDSCYNPASHPKARHVSRNFSINPFKAEIGNINAGTCINTMVVNMATSASGFALKYLNLKTPTTHLMPTAWADESALYNINIPNYYLSGLVVSGIHNGQQCTANAGWGLRVDCAIFRHYDGLDTRRLLQATPSGYLEKGISYELDFNGGYNYPQDDTPLNEIYSDIMVGKNIITCGQNFRNEMNFSLFSENPINITRGDKIRIVLYCTELAGVRVVIRDENGADIFQLGSPNGTRQRDFEVKSINEEKFYLYELETAQAMTNTAINQLNISLAIQNKDCQLASMTLITA